MFVSLPLTNVAHLVSYLSGSLEDAFSVLAKLAEEAGAPEGIEYLQSRASAKTVLLGMPGTLAKIEAGDFPPPPPPEYVPPTDDEEQLE